MTKWPESNGKGTERGGLPATVSSLHPADFPLGSVESRAAARAMIRPGELRAGDKGKTEDGGWYLVIRENPNDPEDRRLLVITFPPNLSSYMPRTVGKAPDGDNCARG